MSRPRETYYDPLLASKSPRWLEIRTMNGQLLEFHPLPANVDITREFVESILNHLKDGWTVPEFSSRTGMYRAVRDRETRLVYVVLVEPGTHAGYGAAHLVSSPGHED